ncbi:hypothetical protein CH333_10085 [candidate division WOR-3 bacterium JGI_Cruoil_03_44_89]|uniref:MobA-like NTP transferase domain-containing protein n=1 Tax=candidate division WOR-3 bacterium JGI_Cruoil_03_44_89 TaxID=1973748 RepID=A0A235BNI1_UNCW3|nr:MAG: hypothetical protein CH333_10085 [candidate division WOR-3 bacterium JGI_Cruoil_03_44_89]
MNISAIILAAGKSERMGTPKPLLTIGGSTFLNTIVRNLKRVGLKEIIVVLGYKAEEIRPHIPEGVRCVVNENYQRGQLSSLKVALNALSPDTDAFLMVLADYPMVSDATYRLIVDLLAKGTPIVLPKYKGKRGHPVGFSGVYISQLMNAPEDVGARFVIKKNIKSVVETPVEDEGVIVNINTREDYKKYILELRR